MYGFVMSMLFPFHRVLVLQYAASLPSWLLLREYGLD